MWKFMRTFFKYSDCQIVVGHYQSILSTIWLTGTRFNFRTTVRSSNVFYQWISTETTTSTIINHGLWANKNTKVTRCQYLTQHASATVWRNQKVNLRNSNHMPYFCSKYLLLILKYRRDNNRFIIESICFLLLFFIFSLSL